MKLRPLISENVDTIVKKERSSSDHPWSVNSLLQSVKSEDDCQIISGNDEDVGYYVLRHAAGVSEILNLVVFHPYQGQGLGKKLLQVIFQQARLNHSKEVWLEVRESNSPARKLYTGAGFIEQGVRKNYYPLVTGSNKCTMENAVLMSMTLET